MVQKLIIPLDIYLIANEKGELFRAARYDKSLWTSDPAKAKVYTKLGPARTRITIEAGRKSRIEAKILHLQAGEIAILDDSAFRNKKILAAERKAAKAAKALADKKLKDAKAQLVHAEKEIAKAKKRVADLQNGTELEKTQAYIQKLEESVQVLSGKLN